MRYAHGKRLYHRALSPQNIRVLDPEAASPHLQVFNWQTAAREPVGSRTITLGALAGAKKLAPGQVRERVADRYPQTEPLPERPDLDALLEQAGSELKWQPDAAGGKGACVSPRREFTTVLSVTARSRLSTVARHFEEVPADKVEIEQFAQRLRYSVDAGRKAGAGVHQLPVGAHPGPVAGCSPAPGARVPSPPETFLLHCTKLGAMLHCNIESFPPPCREMP